MSPVMTSTPTPARSAPTLDSHAITGLRPRAALRLSTATRSPACGSWSAPTLDSHAITGLRPRGALRLSTARRSPAECFQRELHPPLAVGTGAREPDVPSL